MLVQKPPKESLVDSLVHRPYKGEGDYNKPLYGDKNQVDFVRIDRKTEYTFSSNGKHLLRNAKVFCYYGLTTPLPDFKAQDIVIFDDDEHKIVGVSKFKEPFIDQYYSFELDVI